jgi:regulator of RNase E activity RraA
MDKCTVTICFAVVFLVFTTGGSMTERLVPSQYATIQAAIDDCNDGDVIIVAYGTYTAAGNHDIDFKGKAVTVRTMDPKDPNMMAVTVIYGRGPEA